MALETCFKTFVIDKSNKIFPPYFTLPPTRGKSAPIGPTPGAPGGQAGAGGGLLAIVATVGGVLFVCNLCLLYCYVKRRAGKQLLGEILTFLPQVSPRPGLARD